LLLDAFDPAQALPKSAEFLRELRAQFGNLGLAAAAYNAGPQRVQDWLAGKRRLPSETLALCSQRDRPLRRGMEAAPTHGRSQFSPTRRVSGKRSSPQNPHLRRRLCNLNRPAPPGRSSSSATGWRAPRLPGTISCKRSISRSLEAVNRSSCARCWEARRSGIASASRRRLAKQRKRCARSCVQPEEPVWPSATDLQSREPRSTLVQDGTCSFEDLPSSCAQGRCEAED
jgi:Transglycosylase SLT domain